MQPEALETRDPARITPGYATDHGEPRGTVPSLKHSNNDRARPNKFTCSVLFLLYFHSLLYIFRIRCARGCLSMAARGLSRFPGWQPT